MKIIQPRQKPKDGRSHPNYPVVSSVPVAENPSCSSRSSSDSHIGSVSDETRSPGTVLFVSDDDYFRSTMRAFLEDEGFLVRSCADAARVPELFFGGPGSTAGHHSCQSSVDLLLIDVHALGATGLRLAAELTSFEPDLPVIVISVPDGEKSGLAAMARRGWKFVNKPVLLPQLLELIHIVLGPRRAPRRPESPSLASPATGNGPRSGFGRGVGTAPDDARSLFKLPLRMMKTQGRIQ